MLGKCLFAVAVLETFLFAQSAQPQTPAALHSSTAIKAPRHAQSAVGRTGAHATQQNATTTKNAAHQTPGIQTSSGYAQQPGEHSFGEQSSYSQPKAGGPPNFQQAGQLPNEAERDAAAAHLAEIGGPQGTLGVNGAQPSHQEIKVSGRTQF